MMILLCSQQYPKFVLFNPYEHCIDLSNKWYSFNWPSVCLAWQILNVGHHVQTFYPDFFVIPVMLIGTIDFYHFIPLSVTLTMAGGHTVCAKQNMLALLSHTLFS